MTGRCTAESSRSADMMLRDCYWPKTDMDPTYSAIATCPSLSFASRSLIGQRYYSNSEYDRQIATILGSRIRFVSEPIQTSASFLICCENELKSLMNSWWIARIPVSALRAAARLSSRRAECHDSCHVFIVNMDTRINKNKYKGENHDTNSTY